MLFAVAVAFPGIGCEDSSTSAADASGGAGGATSPQLTLDLGSEDATCAGTVTFAAPAAWVVVDDALWNEDMGTVISATCHSRDRLEDRLGYDGPWELESVVEFTQSGRPQATLAPVAVDGHPALRSDSTLGADGSRHAVSVGLLVGDVLVVVEAEVAHDAVYPSVKGELEGILASAVLHVPGGVPGPPA